MEWLNDIREGDDFKFHVLCKRSYLYKKCRIGLRDTQIIILTIMSVDSRGSITGRFSVLCVTIPYYHNLMVVVIENWSQAMTCILTWNTTSRRCEKTGLLWFCWSIHARCEAFVYCWNSFLHLKEKQLFIAVGQNPPVDALSRSTVPLDYFCCPFPKA